MKIIYYLIVLILTITILNFWYEVYVVGQYYQNAGLLFTLLLGVIPVVTIYTAYKLITYIKSN